MQGRVQGPRTTRKECLQKYQLSPLAQAPRALSDGNMLETPEPNRQPEASGAPPLRRTMMVGMMGIAVIAGLSSRLAHHQDATPATPPATHQSAPALPKGHAVTAAAQFDLIAPEHAAQALARSGLPADQQASILAAVKRRDYRLVEMPIYDNSGAGGIVSVRSGMFAQQVALSSVKPTTVILPIRISGEVDIFPVSDPGVAGIAPAAITSTGPTALPIIQRDEYLVLNVIAQ